MRSTESLILMILATEYILPVTLFALVELVLRGKGTAATYIYSGLMVLMGVICTVYYNTHLSSIFTVPPLAQVVVLSLVVGTCVWVHKRMNSVQRISGRKEQL
jgi:hypothetical protein